MSLLGFVQERFLCYALQGSREAKILLFCDLWGTPGPQILIFYVLRGAPGFKILVFYMLRGTPGLKIIILVSVWVRVATLIDF